MRCLTIIFGAVLVLFSLHQAQAKIIHVPDDSSTIQGGINGAVNGDTVLVAEGHYYERISFYGKRILVTSEFMNDSDAVHIHNTIIDANTDSLGVADTGSVVCFASEENSGSVLQGFTIQNGIGTLDESGYRRGGGIYCGHSSPTITSCTITDNEAEGGGGTLCLQSSPNIESCTIIGNTAFYWPGGNHIIADNKDNLGPSGVGSGGGILCLDSSHPAINNCTIRENTAFVPLAGGFGGGISCLESSPVITYCAICRNGAISWGGGIICVSSFLSILNSTITQNEAIDGGGILCNDCLLWINNSILWNDTPDEIYEYPDMPSNVIVTFSDVEGWLGALNCCPMFCNSNNDNYYLSENSCCVGAGEGGVDIGAFGVGCSYLLGDANGDGVINSADVVYLINYLFKGGPAPDPLDAGDVNCDGEINSADVVYLIDYLFKGGPPPCEP